MELADHGRATGLPWQCRCIALHSGTADRIAMAVLLQCSNCLALLHCTAWHDSPVLAWPSRFKAGSAGRSTCGPPLPAVPPLPAMPALSALSALPALPARVAIVVQLCKTIQPSPALLRCRLHVLRGSTVPVHVRRETQPCLDPGTGHPYTALEQVITPPRS
jgi:hypothetical protein